jgi:hypothetical protein
VSQTGEGCMYVHKTGYIIALVQEDYNITAIYYFGNWKEEVISVVTNIQLLK